MARELSLNDQKLFKAILKEKCRQAYSDALEKCIKIVDGWKAKPSKDPADAFFNLYGFMESEDWRINKFYYNEHDYEKIISIVVNKFLLEEEMIGISDKGRQRVLKDAEAYRQEIQERISKHQKRNLMPSLS